IYVIAWNALKTFVSNGGKIRIVCSPYIKDEDKIALEEGYNARTSEIITDSLKTEIQELFDHSLLNKPSRVLSCLVAINVIDLKVAILKPEASPETKRLFHDKVGIFKDRESNHVGFRGSMNETFKGLSSDGNIESIDVFPSWLDTRDSKRVENALIYFNKLWDNKLQSVDVFDFPSAAKELLTKYTSQDKWNELLEEVSVDIDLGGKWSADRRFDGRIPRDHQIRALEEWEKHGKRGIFEHATGSGKTYTAMCAIRPALINNEIPLILLPSSELLKQWYKELKETFDEDDLSFLICGDGNNLWKKPGYLSAWTQSSPNKKKVILTTMDTAASDPFIKGIQMGSHLFVIADEVHRLGSTFRSKVFKINSGSRLGLSATPIRYGDEVGTNKIFEYFEGIIPPPFTLKDAIQSGVLTKYFYHPHEINLKGFEQDEWDDISNRLSKLIAIKGAQTPDIMNDSQIRLLLIQRSRIIKNAIAKVNLSVEVLNDHFEIGQKWIVYCDNQTQLSQVLGSIRSEGYDAYEYHSSMQGDRDKTLSYFSLNGGILVSIKCLDEGVDIPSATHALILASSKNPREFIQRRGRILRKSKNKHLSFLHDAIVTPCKKDDGLFNELSILSAHADQIDHPTPI
ncbi:MAG: DEAD/DEAH box helicase family protein, partial [Candidatus Theseobacter exili]|nr:DEAD/DEAH box helicase family protein [Candidatus Theseobacter exili]